MTHPALYYTNCIVLHLLVGCPDIQDDHNFFFPPDVYNKSVVWLSHTFTYMISFTVKFSSLHTAHTILENLPHPLYSHPPTISPNSLALPMFICVFTILKVYSADSGTEIFLLLGCNQTSSILHSEVVALTFRHFLYLLKPFFFFLTTGASLSLRMPRFIQLLEVIHSYIL